MKKEGYSILQAWNLEIDEIVYDGRIIAKGKTAP
jgi:hypothetical protein